MLTSSSIIIFPFNSDSVLTISQHTKVRNLGEEKDVRLIEAYQFYGNFDAVTAKNKDNV